MSKKVLLVTLGLIAALVFVAGCKPSKNIQQGNGLSGRIKADGSSTVFPIMEAASEEFQGKSPKVKVTIGLSGTGGGFEKFGRGEIDIANASRPIKSEEAEAAKKNGIEYIELPVAYDGIAIVVNPKNDWADSITVQELKKLWEPSAEGKIERWNQLRPEWPDKKIRLFGAGTDSGTFDYFTKAIVGEEGASRGDYTSSEDDNVLVQGVATDEVALGYFGIAYYEQNKDRLKLLPVDDENDSNGKGPIKLSKKTVVDGTYQPLSRPMFIYIKKESAKRKEIKEFIDFVLTEGVPLVEEVGYIALPEEAYDLARERFKNGTTGSIFGEGGSQVGVSVEETLKKAGGDKK